MFNVMLIDGESDEWEVKAILIVFLHGRNIEACPLKLHILAFLCQVLDYFLQLFAFEQAIGSKQANMEGLRPIEVLGMIVKDIHILQFLRDNYFFLQESSYQRISQGSQGVCDMFGHLKINDRNFLAFGVFVKPCEVVYPCELQGVFVKDSLYVLLEVCEERGEAGLGGLVTEDEFEKSQVGQLVAVFAQDVWRTVLGARVQSFSEPLLELQDLLALLWQSEREGGEVCEEGAVFDYVLVLIRHYIFFYKVKFLNSQRKSIYITLSVNQLIKLIITKIG